jgi:hypothetical protein
MFSAQAIIERLYVFQSASPFPSQLSINQILWQLWKYSSDNSRWSSTPSYRYSPWVVLDRRKEILSLWASFAHPSTWTNKQCLCKQQVLSVHIYCLHLLTGAITQRSVSSAVMCHAFFPCHWPWHSIYR